MWFTRDSFDFIPEGTAAKLHLSLDRGVWKNIEQILGHALPAPGIGLTVDDLRSFTKGEIEIYFLESGETALAVRAKQKNLPSEKLETLGLVVTKMERQIFLLSRQELKTHEYKSTNPWPFQFPIGWTWPMGSLTWFDGKNAHTGAVFVKNGQVIIRTSKPLLANRVENIYLAGNKAIIQFSNENQAEVMKMYQDANVQQSVRLKKFSLPDGTIAQELLAEETKTETFVHLAQKDGKTYLSNEQFPTNTPMDEVCRNQIALSDLINPLLGTFKKICISNGKMFGYVELIR